MTTHTLENTTARILPRRLLEVALVFVVVTGLLAGVPRTSNAAGSTVANEIATLVDSTDWQEVDGMQHVSNNATSGTFTLSFAGQGPTNPIPFDADPAVLKQELEMLANIFEVNVVPLVPLPPLATNGWKVTFVDRAASIAMSANDTLLGGITAITVAEPGLSVPIDPSGIAYIGNIDRLLVTDSEINEEPAFFDGVNTWEMLRTGAIPNPPHVGEAPYPSWKMEPTGLAYDPVRKNVFFSNDWSTQEVAIVNVGPNGHFDWGSAGSDDVFVGSFLTSGFGLVDLEDVAFDPISGHLFLTDGVGNQIIGGPRFIYEISIAYGPPLTASLVRRLDVSKFNAAGVPVADIANAQYIIDDIEGIGYRAASDTLLFTDGHAEVIYELSKDGYLIRSIDVFDAIGGLHVLADIATAPASDGSSAVNMYVVDRGADPGLDYTDKPPLDGRLYELSAPFSNLAPFVNAGADKTVSSLVTSLDGTAFDDGQPLDGLTTTWSKVSGPGAVTFGNANSVDTSITFKGGGVFVLQLRATDGVNPPSVDTVTVTVDQPPVANTFIDDDGNPHEANIEAIAALGITNGCNPPANDKYCPERSVTRAEMAVFLVQSMGEAGNLSTYQGYFSDVTTGSWFTPWVERLYQLGVTVGFPDGTYRPDKTVTRGEMAVFLVKAFDHTAELVPPTGVFGDVDLAAFYADDAELIKRLGITAGCSTSPLKYCPDNPVRRDHMATFLAKALGL